jgi:hypothetical protein
MNVSRRVVYAALIALGALLRVGDMAAQTAPVVPGPGEDIYEVRLTDGSTVFARISAVEGDTVVLTTAGGIRLEVERSQIGALERADGQLVSGEFWHADPNASRLFFTATGRSLDAGRAYFGTHLIVFPFLAVGVTDWLTLAGGAPVLVGEVEPFYLAPKIQLVGTERASFSVGTLHLFLSDDFNDTDVGIAYGVGTFGTRDNAVTAGVGFGYAGSDFENQPVAMIGGEARISRRAKLLTENYFLPGETGAVFSFGFRFLGERLSADIGIGGAAGDGGGGCCLPLVNVSYAFGGAS